MSHSSADGSVTGSATIGNEAGLHARPSVKLTQLAKSFDASVEVALAPDGPWFNAKSPVAIMRVRAAKGTVVHFRSTGADAQAAVHAVVALVDRRFDESEGSDVTPHG